MSALGTGFVSRLLATGLGAVAGAVAVTWIECLGLKRDAAGYMVGALGGLLAALADSTTRVIGQGMAALGAGQLVAGWFSALDKRLAPTSASSEVAA